MKRYLVFGGDAYYPSGGWEDFQADFDTKELAILAVTGGRAACKHAGIPNCRMEWNHIIDLETGEEIWGD